MKYIDFNDESLPIGKRKQAYVKFAVSKGTDIVLAKRQANKKFGFEQKAGILAIARDSGRRGQRSFTGLKNEAFLNYDLRKYKESIAVWEEDYVELTDDGYCFDPLNDLINKYTAMNFKIIYVDLIG